jgi:hypothetical protein
MSLFPREAHNEDLRAMANRLLDDAKAGFDISEDRITWALRVTGDLEG